MVKTNIQINQIQAILMIIGALFGVMLDGVSAVAIGILLGWVIGKFLQWIKKE